MDIKMDQQLRQDIQHFRLVFCCEECVHGAEAEGVDVVDRAEAEGEVRCAVLYPTRPHRRRTVEATADGQRLQFCKMFEAR